MTGQGRGPGHRPVDERTKYRPKLALGNEFIEEFEGTGKDRDIIRWSQLTAMSGVQAEMPQRLNECFERWLNP